MGIPMEPKRKYMEICIITNGDNGGFGCAQFWRGFQISWSCQLKTIDEEFDAVHVFCFEALALQDGIPTLAQVILWNFIAWKQKYTNNKFIWEC